MVPQGSRRGHILDSDPALTDAEGPCAVPLCPMSDTPLRPAVSAALEHYDMEVRSVTPIRFVNNAVFRVETSDGDAALRIHRPGHRSPSETRSELTFTEALHAEDIVEVPVPIRTGDDDLIAVVEDAEIPYHASLVRWIDGEVKRPGSGAGSATIERIGRTLAQIHEFGARFEANRLFNLPTLDVRRVLDRDVASETLQRLVAEVRRLAEERLSEIPREPEHYGVIHHDYILLNCLQVGRRTAVIDFDDCGWGHHLQDIGGMLGNLAEYPSPGALRASFVEGYESVRPFPAEDERDEHLAVALRHATSALWLLDRRAGFSDDRFNQTMEYRIISLGNSLAALGEGV